LAPRIASQGGFKRTKPYQPWHTHDEVQKLTLGEFYPLDIEIWPTSIVVIPAYRLVVRFEGADFQRALQDDENKSAIYANRQPIGNRGSGGVLT
jgi:hypothetical protein